LTDTAGTAANTANNRSHDTIKTRYNITQRLVVIPKAAESYQKLPKGSY